MILRQTDSYIKICMNTWLLCEACIHSEQEKLNRSDKLLQVCRDCAQSCLAIASQIINDPAAVQKNVFNCFLYCRECYNECMLHQEDDIEYCGQICGTCAEKIKELLYFHLN
jgi:hypothetical protein